MSASRDLLDGIRGMEIMYRPDRRQRDQVLHFIIGACSAHLTYRAVRSVLKAVDEYYQDMLQKEKTNAHGLDL